MVSLSSNSGIKQRRIDIIKHIIPRFYRPINHAKVTHWVTILITLNPVPSCLLGFMPLKACLSNFKSGLTSPGGKRYVDFHDQSVLGI